MLVGICLKNQFSLLIQNLWMQNIEYLLALVMQHQLCCFKILLKPMLISFNQLRTMEQWQEHRKKTVGYDEKGVGLEVIPALTLNSPVDLDNSLKLCEVLSSYMTKKNPIM